MRRATVLLTAIALLLGAAAPPLLGQVYDNCTEVWKALGRPIYSGEPGYGPHLDSDGDGIGCAIRDRQGEIGQVSWSLVSHHGEA